MYTYTSQYQQQIETDVLVIGSGSSGATAAIAAGMHGADVMLVERYGFMGGISTQVLDTFYGFYTPGENPRKVVGGVPDRIVDQLKQREMAFERPNTYGAGTGVTYDPETLKYIWEQTALKSGVKLLYHTIVVDAIVEQDRIIGIVAATKKGLIRITANVFIDASGDADVAAAAGVSYEGEADGPVQAMTTTFRLVNVNTKQAKKVTKDKLHHLMQKAADSGEYDLPRKEGSVHITPFEGVMATNMVRVSDIDGTDAEQLTRAEINGRQQAFEYARFLRDHVPGYNKSHISSLSTQIGIRESRRILGEYRLTREDVMSARKFDDAIGQCGAPMEDHHSGSDTKWQYLPEGETYHIPYRCLIPRDLDGLLVVGRCLSADHDAHASVRNMAQCMTMGQAAGVAASIATNKHTSVKELAIPALQDQLRNLGAILE